MVFVVIYILLAFITAYIGNKTRIGFWGVFLLSFLFTPFVTLIFLFFMKEPDKKEKVIIVKEEVHQ